MRPRAAVTIRTSLLRTPALILSAALAAPAVATPTLAELDLVGCAQRLAARFGDDVWPGWSKTPFSFLLVDADREILICPPRGIQGFQFFDRPFAGLDCAVVWRDRQFAVDLLATFPAFSSEPTVVMGTMQGTGKTAEAWLLTLLHEHFHQLQYSSPGYYEKAAALGLSGGDQTGMWMLNYDFPYQDPAVQKAVAALAQGLGRAIAAHGTAEFAGALAQVQRDWRALRQTLPADDYRYFQFQVWQEGVARYVEIQIGERVARERFNFDCAMPMKLDLESHVDGMVRELREGLREAALDRDRRVAFYPVGAAIALLLDKTHPDWKSRYLTEPFEFERYFAN